MKTYNLNRISRRCIGEYINARKNGLTFAIVRTKVLDYNALALAIKARGPALTVSYICLTDKIKIEK